MKEAEEKAIQMNQELGYVNYKDLIKLYGMTQAKILNAGGIKDICKKHGLNYVCAHKSDPNDIKKDFCDVYHKLGHIDIETYLKHGKYSKQAIRTAFGSFNNLMKELGIPLNMSRMEGPEEVLNDIKLVVEQFGTTSSTVYRREGKYAQSVVERLFGSWDNALKQLGFTGKNKKVGKEEMVRQLRAVYDYYGCLSTGLINSNCTFTYQAAVASFGCQDAIALTVSDKNAFVNQKSSGHIAVRTTLQKLLPPNGFEEEKTFDWLINPETGFHLYVDFCIEKYKLCIEFDGEQHYHRVKHFQKTEDDFLRTQQRDRTKGELLKQHGYTLIRYKAVSEITADSLKPFIE